MEIQRFVAGRRADGSSVVDADEPVRPLTVRELPGVEFYKVWGSNESPAVGTGPGTAEFAPYFPAPGGYRFMVLRWPPEAGGPAAPEEVTGGVEDVFPGLLSSMRPDEAGLHITDTVDLALILEGELWLEFEAGTRTRLTPGSCVTLRGSRHTWRNTSDEPALMAWVSLGAEQGVS